MTRRFWLAVDHATALAHHALEDFGWTLTGGNDWQLAWTLDLPDADALAAAAEGRWINHIHGIAALAVKSHLCMTLRAGAQRASAAGAGALFAFAPQTFVLPSEWDEWIRARAWHPDAIWIQKPADSSRGRGVALVSDPAEVRAQLRRGDGQGGGSLVVQRYIDNPHLLDGYKYSLRCYVLITSVEPLIAYLFDDGFTKLASRPFSLAAADRADRFRHLTNPDILRDDPLAEGVSTRNTTHREYRRRLRDSGVDDDGLFCRIRRALAATLIAAQPALLAARQASGRSSRGQFELLGMDVAIDDQLQPWLLECNLSPSLSVEATAATEASREEAAIKIAVVRDTLRLVGVDEDAAPAAPPASVEEARTRLAWHDGRRGGFTRLWPSREAVEALPAAGALGELDRALLADEAGRGGWPQAISTEAETIHVGGDALLFEAARDRLTLLDAGEREAWRQLSNTPATEPPASAFLYGIEWLREGLLLPARVIGSATIQPRIGLQPRRRRGWNDERVYALHGLKVAVLAASPRQAAAIDQALGWWDAGDESAVDATLVLTPRMTASDVVAGIHQLALRRVGGIVRRTLTYARKGAHLVLVVGGTRQAARLVGDGWTIVSRPTVIGGSPCGAWEDVGGVLEPLPVSRIAGASDSRGELMLELVSDGPGVIHDFSVAGVRALAAWIESLPLGV